jgi:uncharacterized protein (DUF2249 family)
MNEPNHELDLGDLSLPERHAQARAAIDAMAPGDSLTLVGAKVPRELLHELLGEAPGRYEWSRLEGGPERARVALRRRKSEGPRSVTLYLQSDHERLDAIVPEVVRPRQRGLLRRGPSALR